jgi:hypothetical protein
MLLIFTLLHRVASPLHADRLGPVVLLDIGGLVALGLLIGSRPLLIASCLRGTPASTERKPNVVLFMTAFPLIKSACFT